MTRASPVFSCLKVVHLLCYYTSYKFVHHDSERVTVLWEGQDHWCCQIDLHPDNEVKEKKKELLLDDDTVDAEKILKHSSRRGVSTGKRSEREAVPLTHIPRERLDKNLLYRLPSSLKRSLNSYEDDDAVIIFKHENILVDSYPMPTFFSTRRPVLSSFERSVMWDKQLLESLWEDAVSSSFRDHRRWEVSSLL